MNMVTKPTAHDSSARRTGPALEAMYQFILWLVPTIEKFPRSQKFLLGDRMQTVAVDCLELLVSATYTRERHNLLRQANLRLEHLRYFIRLCHDLKHMDHRRYEHAARQIDTVGRLVGGWAKADQGVTSS